jgi:hypothetical protein
MVFVQTFWVDSIKGGEFSKKKKLRLMNHQGQHLRMDTEIQNLALHTQPYYVHRDRCLKTTNDCNPCNSSRLLVNRVYNMNRVRSKGYPSLERIDGVCFTQLIGSLTDSYLTACCKLTIQKQRLRSENNQLLSEDVYQLDEDAHHKNNYVSAFFHTKNNS